MRVLRYTLSSDAVFSAYEDAALAERLSVIPWRGHGDGYAHVCGESDAPAMRTAIEGVAGAAEEDITGEYVLGTTRDSARYDGFGTLSLAEHDGVRTVAIRREHLDWQTTRYDSFTGLEA